MRPSRSVGVLSRALVVVLVVAVAAVGLPGGSGGGPGLGRLWSALSAWLTPSVAQAEPAQAAPARALPEAVPVKAAEPPRRVRELGEKRSATTRVFALSDGTFEAEVSPEPESYVDSSGVWRDIDTMVRELGRDGYRFGNDSNGFRSSFGDKSDRVARVELGGRKVALGIEGAPRSLSPRVEGDTVTYPGAFDRADVAYEVTRESVKERIVLAQAPADPVWRFTLQAGGVQARVLPDGSIGFFADGAAGDGPPVFVMPKPFMNDSRPDPKAPHGKAFSDKVSQTVEQQGANITITVRADREWLAAPERQYPVVIDPTIKVEPTPTTGQDTQIWSDTPTRNDGSDYRLSVGSDAWGAARSLLRFDTSAVPAGTALTGAKLRMYFDSEIPSTQVNNTIEVRRVTQSWSEDTATWNLINTAFAEAGLSTQVKQVNVANVWHEFDVRNIAQSWVSGSAQNYGFMLKATNEALNRSGPVYQAAEYAYNGEIENRPKLVLSYGRPSVDLRYPTKIYSTGAELHWAPYVDPDPNNPNDDVVEYQVHRTVFQTFTPSRWTLVAPLTPAATTFTDTTATPTPADSPDPFGAAYYYMIAAKTRDGQLIPGPTQVARLPKAGLVTQTFHGGAADSTISSAQPGTNLNVYTGQPWLAVGNNSTTYGNTRAVVKFPDLSAIPQNAHVVDADFQLWGFYTSGSGATFDAHPLTKSFTETETTWNRASNATAWTVPGGDYGALADQVVGIGNDPAWHIWENPGVVQGWVTNPASNNGFLVKVRDEAGAAKQRALFLSDEAAEPQLRPNLVVTYTEPTAEGTYYAPDTPSVRMIPGDEYTIPVTLTNTTTGTWAAASRVLSYRWSLPDGTDVTTGGNRLETALPADVPANGTVTVQARVKTPIQSEAGNKREQFVLNWDLRDTTAGTWLSATGGIPALPQNVTVEDPTSDQLGLEKFYSYAGKSTGAGSNVLVNQFAGNTVFSYDALSNPGRGLSTFVRMTYNSQDTSATAMGYGWSLAASGLVRLGASLELHPKGQDYPSTITLPDGDGTSHVFTLNQHDSSDPAVWTYDPPAGVHLFLQRLSGEDTTRRWVATRPDRTQFFFDDEGWMTAVVDRNGNTQQLTYTERKSNNQPRKFLAYVTDPAGRQSLSVDYWEKGETSNPKIIDMVQSIKDVSGRTLTFGYDDKGLLTELVDGAGTAEAKTFRFGYDATQGNKNVKLVSITDPRGHATSLAYYAAPVDPKDKWKLQTLTDRLANRTGFAYADPDGSTGSEMESTVTDAENHVTTFRMDGYGRPIRTTNAKNETTGLAWDADNNVVSVTEPNNAVSTWTYDAKTGYPTTIRDAEAVAHNTPATVLAYQTGLGGYTADLTGKTSPQGRRWSFGYDARGNLTTVTDPKGTATTGIPDDYQSVYSYDTFGQLQTATDANGNTTTFADYDPTGYPRRTTDPLTHATTAVYDVRGNVTSTTDAAGKTTTAGYDVFGRPLQTRAPKDQAAGEFIVTPAPVYDPNDNITQATAPNGAVSTAAYDNADQLTTRTEPKDTPTGPVRTSSFTYDKVGNLLTETQPLGTLTPADPNDYLTRYSYDQISQLTGVTNAANDVISYRYDNVGNLTTVVDPRTNDTPDPADVTTTLGYDLNHRQTSTTDALGNITRTGYDRDGNVTTTTDATNVVTTYVLDERGKPVEVRAPHQAGIDRITKIEYDEVGNQTRVISPRGTETTADPNDFATAVVYDKLNRPIERRSAFDADTPGYTTADITTYAYDAVGNLAEESAPPSAGQTVRNTTRHTYFDNGWVRTSTDPWDIVTSYDYNALGQQTARTLSSAGGSADRSMGWDYFPDGKLKSRSDDGVPIGRDVALADNSDTQNTTTTGSWGTAATGTGYQGYDYRTAPAGTGGAKLTWTPVVTRDGSYEIFVKHPGGVPGAASNASFTVNTGTATTTVPVDQTQRGGEWISLGSYTLTAGNTATVSLSDNANGTVLADAVKLVRNNSGDTDTEAKTFGYSYDANGNLTALTDTSPGAPVDAYALTYNGLNQLTTVQEKLAAVVKNTTAFTYDPNGNPATRDHDTQDAAFTYDPRDLLASVTTTETGQAPKTTGYTYTPRGQVLRETKSNGNTVDYGYHLDGQLASQIEKKTGGTLVAQHLLDYTANGDRNRDASKIQNADNPAAYLDEIREYVYDPQDRISGVTKKNAATGAVLETENYVHDANASVTSQTVEGVTTTFTYDRNRLVSAATGGATAGYNYDPFGRLNTVISAGQVLESYTYDGFDRTTQHKKLDNGTLKVTDYSYDPLDRTVTKTDNVGTPAAKTTDFAYLGLTDQVVTEEIGGEIQRSYAYDPVGQRLSQLKHDTDGAGPGVAEDSVYGYNPHSDVETLTSPTGDTRATYGYTAYGSNDEQAFTGIDKPEAQNPGKEPYNFYRYSSKRWDPAAGSYDMGFRDYNPGLNRFLTRDTYNGALADLNLGTDPWTANRYSFTGGNPVSRIELDGHEPMAPACSETDMVACRNYYYTGEMKGANPDLDPARVVDENGKWMHSSVIAAMGPTALKSAAGGGPKPTLSEDVHGLLDVLGLIPGLGEPADGANCGLYAAEGQGGDAALSCAAMIPVLGWLSTIFKGAKHADEAADATKSLIQTNKAVGDAASDAIASRYPGSVREKGLEAASGWRYIDVFTPSRIAIESKVGRTSLSADVRLQIQKDVELRESKQVVSLEWHFTTSPTTGLGGPTAPLREALTRAGIKIVEW